MERKVIREADLFGSNENLRELPPAHATGNNADHGSKNMAAFRQCSGLRLVVLLRQPIVVKGVDHE